MPGKAANKKDRKFKKNDKLTGILEQRKIVKKDKKRGCYLKLSILFAHILEILKEQNAAKREKEKEEKRQALSKFIEVNCFPIILYKKIFYFYYYTLKNLVFFY